MPGTAKPCFAENMVGKLSSNLSSVRIRLSVIAWRSAQKVSLLEPGTGVALGCLQG